MESQLGRLNISKKQPLRWFNVTEHELDVGTSKVNFAEVVQVLELPLGCRGCCDKVSRTDFRHIPSLADGTYKLRLRCDPLLNGHKTIMIITLYKPQASLLKDTLQKFLPHRLDNGSVQARPTAVEKGFSLQ